MTVLELLDLTTDYFKKNNLVNPRLDAEVLLAHAFKATRLSLYMSFDKVVSEDEKTIYRELVKRRAKGEPVAYLTGTKEFWSMPLAVGPGVLIPRPETEVLVETVLKKMAMEAKTVLEIATGSGAITCALAKEKSTWNFFVTDISPEALEYSRKNFEALGVMDRITVLKHDFLNESAENLGKAPHLFDLVISNPPYVRREEISHLAPDIRDFEPALALDGGIDGLDFYRRIGQGAPSLLKAGGILSVEIGEDQAESVSQIFKDNGLSAIEVIKDYAGLDRVVTGKSNG